MSLTPDLDFILEHTPTVWRQLQGQRIFITGGTGFFGTWLLETLAWANQKLALNMSVTVLSRNPLGFGQKAPHLFQNPTFTFVTGDVRNFAFPAAPFSHIIHGGSEASAKLNTQQPDVMLDSIVQGTRRTLEFAEHVGAKKFLLLSSGAVYGRQLPGLERITEDYQGQHDFLKPRAAYALGKCTAEYLSMLHGQRSKLEVKIARCFAFVGPYLPLHRHFAIGNFIRDRLLNKTIGVQGDGNVFRSYQYAADLMIWLLQILCFGESCTPYNVGSDEAISIGALAELIAKEFSPTLNFTIAEPIPEKSLPERYVPSTQRARQDLGLTNHIPLTTAIEKTLAWYAHKNIGEMA